ncbi:hypothetical protein PMIT1342_00617 [Prochlorococcus marinus str. MIT 1342]|nr:hypothetical protein PMIT1313_02623 [Prochlorococcus marinus str. MIT 1313]KZR73195.1 hypothetical protein PMIT1318_00528 [Prochlorococcus marinus str. MIT 1318]KZR77577.1 hypothetical protein PMIT1320_00347 [Prochlorococcus marinus str. MIT 1320]KZR82966.1 hypothetical protein PMIT1342_00617 [Prochlorococcus marinus str. MIT 1342]
MQLERTGQSWCGNLSLVFALIPIVLIVLLLITGFPILMSLYVFVVGILPVAGALALGLVGIFQKSKRRITAFCGTAISSAYVITFAAFAWDNL